MLAKALASPVSPETQCAGREPLASGAENVIRLHDPLHETQWDAWTRSYPAASFYHSSSWARVLHETYGYTPLYLSLGTADSPRAVLPIMEVQSLITGRRGISLPFTDDCEPAASSSEAFAKLISHAHDLGTERRWRYFETRGTGSSLIAPTSARYLGHRLTLHADEAALFRQFHSATRRAVRKAARSDLSVEISTTREAVRDFYQLFCLTRKRHGVPPQPFAFYENIRRYVLAPGNGALFLVRIGRRPVAGALFLHGRDMVTMKFAASDLRYQSLRINNLALWAAMKHYALHGFQTMDFGRTALANTGLRRFKQRWGAVEHDINYHRYDFRRCGYVGAKENTFAATSFLMRNLPLAFSRAVGAVLYRHAA